jgi:hypothetical protein
MIKVIIRKIKTLMNDPEKAIYGKLKNIRIKRADSYLKKTGLYDILISGDSGEYKVNPYDQYNLYKTIRKRNPKQILEFGVGFSSLTIAKALSENHKDDLRKGMDEPGELISIDSNKEWIENTKNKFPEELMPYVDIRYSEAKTAMLNDEICHIFVELPDISPDFMYIDGPAPRDVIGKVENISFVLESGEHRTTVPGDLLLLESTLSAGFYLIVDGRVNAMHFLRRNLKRKYKYKWDRVMKYSTFELNERT